MKQLIIVILLISMVLSSLAQQDKWENIYNENGFSINAKKTDCIDSINGIYKNLFVIQITNTTSYNAEVQWNYHLWNNNYCKNCKVDNSDITYYNSRIEAGETIEGSCINSNADGLSIFSHYLNYNNKSNITRITINTFNIKFE